MIEWLADAIRDHTFQTIYILVGMAVLVGPMLGLAVWYHLKVGRSEGGRALMREQARHNKGGQTLPGAIGNLGGAAKMARDISKGVYGDEVRRQQNITCLYVAGWLLANALVFGALIWAQEVNKQRDAAAGRAPAATQAPKR